MMNLALVSSYKILKTGLLGTIVYLLLKFCFTYLANCEFLETTKCKSYLDYLYKINNPFKKLIPTF